MAEMLEMIRSLGDQLRWATDVEVSAMDPHREAMVVGMGGSGVSGDCAAAIGAEAGYRVAVHKGYPPLPAWAAPASPLVVGISYSGNTEETMATTSWAADQGMKVVIIAGGGDLSKEAADRGWPAVMVPTGFQPRAAAGWLLGALLRVIHAAGLGPDPRRELAAAAAVADAVVEEDGESWHLAMQVADALVGSVPVIRAGSGIAAAAADRWRTQINETSKTPALTSILPESNHNQIEAWGQHRLRFAVVDLIDHGEHPRVTIRRAHTRAITAGQLDEAGEVSAIGKSPLERLISLTAIGDIVAWRLADLGGVDPVEVAVIEELKSRLSQEQMT